MALARKYRLDKKSLEKLKERFGFLDFHFLLRDAMNSNLKSNFADFIYANNMLHDLENKENIFKILKESHRILKIGGVLFGRTLLNKINKNPMTNSNTTNNQCPIIKSIFGI